MQTRPGRFTHPYRLMLSDSGKSSWTLLQGSHGPTRLIETVYEVTHAYEIRNRHGCHPFHSVYDGQKPNLD
jgi:hypothetical protein